MTCPALRSKKLVLLAPALFLAAANTARADFGGAVSPRPHELFQIGGLPITNSMVTSWFFLLVIIVLFRWAAGHPKLIPTRGQTVVENMIEAVRGIVEPIVGSRMIKPTFPLLICLFIYILIMNWSGLLPGAGTFGMMEHAVVPASEVAEYQNEEFTVQNLGNGNYDVHKFDYFFRPSNADLNAPLALAIISWFAWLYFVLRYAGAKVLIHDLFGNKANKKEVPPAMYLMLTFIFLAVGVIEVVSILFRLVSLPFRLFGNVFGGENLISSIHGLVPYIVPVLFYGLEFLIGLIQAFVFTLLVAVYIGLICNHDGGHDEEHDEEHGTSAHEGDIKVSAHN